MTRLLVTLVALCSASCAMQLSASTGGYCYTSSSERRCFDTETERRADFEHRQHDRIARHQLAETENKATTEARAADAAEEERMHQLKLAKDATNPAVAVPVLSMMICSLESDIAGDRAAIARDDRITQTSGVSDFHARREAAEDIDASELSIAKWSGVLRRRFGAEPMPCNSLGGLAACHAERAACDDESARQDDLWRNVSSKLDD